MTEYFELGKSVNGQGCIRVVRDAQYLKDIQSFVKANPTDSLYMSVYKFTELNVQGAPIYDTARMDKFFLEIDSEGHELLNTKTWHQLRHFIDWCNKESTPDKQINLQIFFSGRSGYHILIKLSRDFDVMKDKNVIQYIIRQMAKLSGVDFDMQANNGFAQMRRIPNTINHKSGLYCIPLTIEEAYNYTPEAVMHLAKKKRKLNNTPEPSSYFDYIIPAVLKHLRDKRLRRVDTEYYQERTIKDQLLRKLTNTAYGHKPIRACILDMMTKSNPNFEESTYIALELMRCEYDLKDMLEIFRQIRGPEKFDYKISHMQLSNMLKKKLWAPSCETLQAKGYCKGNHELNYPHYNYSAARKKELLLKHVRNIRNAKENSKQE